VLAQVNTGRLTAPLDSEPVPDTTTAPRARHSWIGTAAARQ
jgi:hypothetical protein